MRENASPSHDLVYLSLWSPWHFLNTPRTRRYCRGTPSSLHFFAHLETAYSTIKRLRTWLHKLRCLKHSQPCKPYKSRRRSFAGSERYQHRNAQRSLRGTFRAAAAGAEMKGTGMGAVYVTDELELLVTDILIPVTSGDVESPQRNDPGHCCFRCGFF